MTTGSCSPLLPTDPPVPSAPPLLLFSPWASIPGSMVRMESVVSDQTAATAALLSHAPPVKLPANTTLPYKASQADSSESQHLLPTHAQRAHTHTCMHTHILIFTYTYAHSILTCFIHPSSLVPAQGSPGCPHPLSLGHPIRPCSGLKSPPPPSSLSRKYSPRHCKPNRPKLLRPAATSDRRHLAFLQQQAGQVPGGRAASSPMLQGRAACTLL